MIFEFLQVWILKYEYNDMYEIKIEMLSKFLFKSRQIVTKGKSIDKY